jgi:putative endonuclease
MAFMYILECADGTYYVGSTLRLQARLWQHENGLGANYTRKRLPVKLVYTEEYPQVFDAFMREKQVQGWSHAKKKALIERNEGAMHCLAECRNETHWNRSFRLRSMSGTIPAPPGGGENPPT